MRVLMLGWEYPPHISGGLGTACEGLTLGLARQGTEIVFVVPRLYGKEDASHMHLVEALGSKGQASGRTSRGGVSPIVKKGATLSSEKRSMILPGAGGAYWNLEAFRRYLLAVKAITIRGVERDVFEKDPVLLSLMESLNSEGMAHTLQQYSWDMFADVAQFANNVVSLFGDTQFDVIHAHDWMTFPAGVALSRITGKPLVVHVHSLEYDRSGAHVNGDIHSIEGWGLHAADAVVGVSYYTRRIIHHQHNVPLDKISVVHNGRYTREVRQSYRRDRNLSSKIVLFLGRITFQKGPDYFVEAAAKVIPHVPDVTFIMAGSGDMLPHLMHRVHELGISEYFHFPGFLGGQDVEQVFSIADVYVMPSVSEPFGISALEAIDFETPVIISKQSGVSEVLHHALKVDFWNVDRMAELIINALVHEELRSDMIAMAREEIRRLHWDAAALSTVDIYNTITG